MILLKEGWWNLRPYWSWFEWLASQRGRRFEEIAAEMVFVLAFGEPVEWTITKDTERQVFERSDGLKIAVKLSPSKKAIRLVHAYDDPWSYDVAVCVVIDSAMFRGKVVGWATVDEIKKKANKRERIGGYVLTDGKLHFGVPDARI